MNERTPLLCFGGPLNGQLHHVRGDVLLAPMPAKHPVSRIDTMLDEALAAYPDSRTVRYDVVQFGYGSGWTSRALVADGYPRHRITDALNAVAALPALFASAWSRRRTYCNDCVAASDPRYNDYVGCVNGDVYGWCSSDNCSGICEYEGRCNCICHGPRHG